MPDGTPDYFEEALADNHSLAAMVKKQFEMINPELLRKSDRLYDGEELDLDAVVRSIVDKKAGSISDERIYWNLIVLTFHHNRIHIYHLPKLS